MQTKKNIFTQDRQNEIKTHLYQLEVEGDDYHGSWWSEKKMKRVLSFFERFHDSSKRYNVLDLGCGGMTLTKQLMNYSNFEVVGIDLVHEILKRIAKVRMPHVPLVTGDATFLPFKEETFDIIIHNQVLHHFFNREIILAELKRVLRPKGLLESIEANGWNLYILYKHYCIWSKIKPFISKNENPFGYIKYKKGIGTIRIESSGMAND